MNSFQDRFSRWHNDVCYNYTPSSNNGWIYTAYSKHICPKSYVYELLYSYYTSCCRSLDPVVIDRDRGDLYPPMSKDEIIGLVSLGLLTSKHLADSGYNFCNLTTNITRKLSVKYVLKSFYGLWRIRKEHRNYAWENNMSELYGILFKLPPWDVYYVNKFGGLDNSIFNIFMFYFNFIYVVLNGNKSSKMILWLQLNDLNSFLRHLIPSNKYIDNYFRADHPFRRRK